MNLPSGAWWKQLSSHLHERTHNRLRGLQIRAVGGRVSIQASAPSDRIRTQAEDAARELVPDGMLAMRIKVDDGKPAADGDDANEPEIRAPGERRAVSSLAAGHIVYRRIQRLINGN